MNNLYSNYSLSTSPGTALAGADFTTYTQQLTFSSGNADPQLVRIPLVDNSHVENDEQFFVSLSTTDPDVNIVNNSATVTIADDDGMYILDRVLKFDFLFFLE